MYPSGMLESFRNASKYYQLQDSCEVYRMQTEVDDYGGIENSYRKHAEYKCRLVFKLEDTRPIGGAVLEDGNYKIHLEFSADLKHSDRIFIKNDNLINRYYEVISVETGSDGMFCNAIVKERLN